VLPPPQILAAATAVDRRPKHFVEFCSKVTKLKPPWHAMSLPLSSRRYATLSSPWQCNLLLVANREFHLPHMCHLWGHLFLTLYCFFQIFVFYAVCTLLISSWCICLLARKSSHVSHATCKDSTTDPPHIHVHAYVRIYCPPVFYFKRRLSSYREHCSP
jgi:hypothetical protein